MGLRSGMRDPRSGKNIFWIPDPGSRGQKGTGSRIRNTGNSCSSCPPGAVPAEQPADCLEPPARPALPLPARPGGQLLELRLHLCPRAAGAHPHHPRPRRRPPSVRRVQLHGPGGGTRQHRDEHLLRQLSSRFFSADRRRDNQRRCLRYIK
jgi:hypothetical protein